ncbi:hypothetical protein [Lysobacter gummosus]
MCIGSSDRRMSGPVLADRALTGPECASTHSGKLPVRPLECQMYYAV